MSHLCSPGGPDAESDPTMSGCGRGAGLAVPAGTAPVWSGRRCLRVGARRSRAPDQAASRTGVAAVPGCRPVATAAAGREDRAARPLARLAARIGVAPMEW